MEVSRIVEFCRNAVQRRCIASLSPGPLYELLARRYLGGCGYRILATNFRIRRLEGDILARRKDGTLMVFEVRGRATSRFLPRLTMTAQKQRALRRLVHSVQKRWREPVRLALVEIIFPLPRSFAGRCKLCLWGKMHEDQVKVLMWD